MGLFSNLFSRKPDKIVETKLGQFTLAHRKKDKSIWSNRNGFYLISVRGTEDAPDLDHLSFCENLDAEIQKLSDKISKKFITEFNEADIEIGFSNWQDRFKIVAASVMLIFQGKSYWNITFEDLRQPYAHFTLYIEGQKLTDFSIDT